MVTVHDVAAASGVSIATVSRTLRVPHRVSEDTRDRVLAAVRALGYQPNRAAAGLRGGRTGVVALVVPDIENPYFASLTKGAQMLTRARGYGLVVVDTTERAEVERDELRALAPQVDGVILASSRLDDDSLIEIAETTRCVLVHRDPGERAPHASTVTIDEERGAHMAVEHLRELGHRRIAYVGGPDSSWTGARRARGVEEASAGLELHVFGGYEPTSRGGREAALAVRESGVTAVIAYNDLVALGLLARFAEAGVRVPDDVSLVGFDNTYVAELSTPTLTSVSADLRELGEVAVEMLLERLDDAESPPRHRELGSRLVVRGSTTAPSSTA